DNDKKLELDANSRDFINLNVKEFREFFSIPYIEGMVGDAIKKFKQYFGKSIPLFISEKNLHEKEFISNYIDSKGGYNKGKYLSHVMRLPSKKQRKALTGYKAKLLRPEVYNYFKDDKTITFVFFTEQEKEHTLDEILRLFSKL
ncbi:hypothetical protein D3M83_10760, partial [Rodentibacter pneumotropicus]